MFESDENVKIEFAGTPRSGFVQPCAAANPAIALRLQSTRLVGRVAELGSLAAHAYAKIHTGRRPRGRHSHRVLGGVVSSG